MSKRSKITLIILIAVVLLVFISLLNDKPTQVDKLEQWEEEIIDPDNNLNPLEETEEDSRFILGVGSKVEGIINKFFSFIFGFFERIVGN